MADQTRTQRASAEPRLESVIAEIRPWMLGQARRICASEADAQDVVQETSTRVLQAIAKGKRLPPFNELEGWLIAIMNRQFIDQCRKRKSAKQGAQDPALERLTMAQPPEPTSSFENVSTEDLAALITKLSPALRTTLELHLSGKRYQEIADALDIRVGTVGKRLTDARKKLLRMLAPFFASGAH